MIFLEHKYSKNKLIKSLQKMRVFPRRYHYEIEDAFGIIKMYSKERLNKSDLDDLMLHIVHKVNKEGKYRVYVESKKTNVDYYYKRAETWKRSLKKK